MTGGNGSPDIELALMRQSLDDLSEDVKMLKDEIATRYVTVDRFEPVRLVAYGAVTVLLGSLLVAIVGLVLTHK